MITNFKLFESAKKYHVDDVIIVTNPTLFLYNRMVVINSIIQKSAGITYEVHNADENGTDNDRFIIKETDIVKKLPTYKEGDYILIKDYYTGEPKPMIYWDHQELGLMGMYDFELDDNVTEPYYNIIRKMNKKDLEKYKDLIEMYHIRQKSNKYNI